MEKQKNREGFTLIEMVCVIAIMGILIAVAVPSYQRIRDGSARQVALASARTNYSMGKAQPELVDAGVLGEDETEDYGYDPDTDSAVWAGAINGREYEAVYPGDSGEGEILAGD